MRVGGMTGSMTGREWERGLVQGWLRTQAGLEPGWPYGVFYDSVEYSNAFPLCNLLHSRLREMQYFSTKHHLLYVTTFDLLCDLCDGFVSVHLLTHFHLGLPLGLVYPLTCSRNTSNCSFFPHSTVSSVSISKS